MARKPREMETHHNQPLTPGARGKLESQKPKEGKKKIVALQLSEKEAMALSYLGGTKALKLLLCPADLCVACRNAPLDKGTHLGAFCNQCQLIRDQD